MAFGDFSFGDGMAGEDPLGAPPPPRDVQTPDAILFDGVGAKNVLLGNGLYEGIHPVDQKVALSLLVTLGTLSSVPELGVAIRTIRYLDSKTSSKVADAVRRALDDLVRDDQIEVVTVDVQVEQRPTGRLLVYVNYRNLALMDDTTVLASRTIQARTYAS